MMQTDLFLAILAMDAYNRSGPSSNVVLATGAGSAIGDFSVAAPTALSNIPGDSFFAAVYTSDTQTIISYRGTDNYYLDGTTGWVVGGGAYGGAQAHDAAALYLQLNGNSATPNNNIILTGDSLGGGLAGFVGEIYGDNAVVFDNMPFELAASLLYSNSTEPLVDPNTGLPIPGSYVDPGARDFFYNGDPIPLSEDNIHGYAVSGEGLEKFRPFQEAPVQNLDPGTVCPSLDPFGYNLHDIANMQNRVELWTADGQHVRWVIAATANITIGHAAFDAAVANWPEQRFTLRQGALVIRQTPHR
jgi:hypothetical protein